MRRPVRTGVVAAGVAIIVGLAGCGGGDESLSSSARVRLAPLVQQVRDAAESRDRAGVQLTLTAVQQAVASGVDKGEISAASAKEILTAVAGVESRIGLVATTTISTTTTTEPPARGPGEKHKDGKGKAGND